MGGRSDTTLKGRGAALVEFVLIVPVIAVLWAGLWQIGTYYALKQRLCVAARYAAWSEISAPAEEAVIFNTRAVYATSFPDARKLIVKRSELPVKFYYVSAVSSYTAFCPSVLPGIGNVPAAETFTLAHNSWTFSGKARQKLYSDRIKNGDTDFRNWKEAEDAVEDDVSGYD